ncbi:MAG: dihydroorotase, partial [Candidatus Thermoplasmatota archaeon]|nr:dihydroorotase [Candidatus Thermoplasmatota archaeon]
YIGIKDGKIDFVKKSYTGTEDVIKVEGVILPAGIDMHVHFRDPGMTEKEDFHSGSVSAACGGITTVMEMPNTSPPTNTRSRLEDKIKIGERKSVIDFGLYGLLSDEIGEMAELIDFFKVYMAPSTDAQALKGEELERLLNRAHSQGVSVAFHPEDQSFFNEPGSDLKSYNESRPLKSELKAIETLKSLPCKDKYVCHLTSKDSLGKVKEYGYVSEVTPHHLFLSDEAFLGQFGKVNPPLRDDSKRFPLWKAFERGQIDIVASDHAPHLEREKEDDFQDAPAGLPGVETIYPLLLNSVSRGKISMSTVVGSIALNPARILGLKKGKIEEGYSADLIVIDFRETEPIKAEKLHYKCGWTPYEDFQGIFPRKVISDGKIIVDDKEFVGEKGDGEYIGKK